MAVTAESVVVELLARTDDFDRKMARAANDFEANTQRIKKGAEGAGLSITQLAGNVARAKDAFEASRAATNSISKELKAVKTDADDAAQKIDRLREALTAARAQQAIYGENLRQAQTALRGFGKANDDAGGGQAKLANAQRNLGFQFQDFTQQLGAGTPLFLAFGQQAGQAAGALADFGGTAGKVGAFLSGPYGSILLVATTLLGNLALTHLSAGDGAKKQENAEKALKDAITALDQATGIANVSQREKINLSRQAAAEALKEAKAKVEVAKADLASARFKELGGRGRALNFGITPVEGVGVASARKEFEKLQASVIKTEEAIRRSAQFGTSELAARAATDPIEKIRQQSEIKRDEIIKLKLDEKAETAALTKLYGDEAAAIARIAAAAKSARAATGDARKAASAALASDIASIERIGLSKGTTANLVSLARDKAAGRPTDFLTQARRGDFDAAVQPAAKVAELTSQLSTQLPQVVLDFKELEGTVKGISTIKLFSPETVQFAQSFTQSLSQGLGQVAIGAANIGDVLVDSFKRAAAEFVANQAFRFLTGALGSIFGGGLDNFAGAAPQGRASGGPVSAGQVVRINETGQEFFRPSVAGRIVPAGQAAMMRGGSGAPITQNININFAGNAATREEAAQFAQIAYEQSLAAIRQTGLIGVPQL